MKQLLHLSLLMLFFTHIKSIDILPFGDHAQALQYIKKHLPENPVILEAGAWNGLDTIRMKEFWPQAIIHSFEPVPDNFKELQMRIKENPDLHIYPYALGKYDGTSDFYVSEFIHEPDVPTGSGSILPPKDHLIYDEVVVFPKKIIVPTYTIDTWAKKYQVKNIDFMWLDMQGYELFALQAAPEILKTVKVIFTELLFVEAYKGQAIYTEIRSWLEKQGFVLVACDFEEKHALKGSDIKPDEVYFGNGIFIKTN